MGWEAVLELGSKHTLQAEANEALHNGGGITLLDLARMAFGFEVCLRLHSVLFLQLRQ